MHVMTVFLTSSHAGGISAVVGRWPPLMSWAKARTFPYSRVAVEKERVTHCSPQSTRMCGSGSSRHETTDFCSASGRVSGIYIFNLGVVMFSARSVKMTGKAAVTCLFAPATACLAIVPSLISWLVVAGAFAAPRLTRYTTLLSGASSARPQISILEMGSVSYLTGAYLDRPLILPWPRSLAWT